MGGVIPAFAGSGNTLYGQISSALDGTIWNGAALEAYNEGHWSDYTIAMPEQSGSGRYILTVPGGLAAGRYFVSVFQEANPPSAAAGDTPTDFVFFDWDGGSVIGVGSALNIGSIMGSAPAATNLSNSAKAMVSAAAAAGTLTSSQMTTTLVDTVPNIYAGRVLIFTSGVNKGLAVLITAYAVTGGKLTFVAYGSLPAPAAPGAGDTFIIQ